MKILLLNDNPVVTKLVTLSAQKTDDEVETAHSVEDAPAGEYDLLVIDDALYDEESFTALTQKVHYKKSLFVCSRDNVKEGDFSATIKKPFLPTDMVELFTNIKRNLDVVTKDEIAEPESIEEISEDELLDGLELEGLDDLGDLGDLGEMDDLDNLDDDLILDDNEFSDDEEVGESVLDDEEAQKVKALLDETQDDVESEDEDLSEEYDLALDLEDEADVDISEPEEGEDFDLALDLEDEADVDISEPEEDADLDLQELGIEEDDVQEVEDISLDEEIDLDMAELDLDSGLDLEEDIDLESDTDTTNMLEAEEEDLQSQIEDAVEELSEEDLQSEVDEETLLEIASNEIDSFANLNSKDLKVALGEESEDEDEEEETELDEEPVPDIEESDSRENKGVESLKTLLKALSDDNVAASLKGAKITINISFED